jgi:hypothetical protein
MSDGLVKQARDILYAGDVRLNCDGISTCGLDCGDDFFGFARIA